MSPLKVEKLKLKPLNIHKKQIEKWWDPDPSHKFGSEFGSTTQVRPKTIMLYTYYKRCCDGHVKFVDKKTNKY